eukprot:PhF_6_TR27344/c0_g1_i2/m.40184
MTCSLFVILVISAFTVSHVQSFHDDHDDSMTVQALRGGLRSHAKLILDEVSSCGCKGPFPQYTPTETNRVFVIDPYLNQNLDLLREFTREVLRHCKCDAQIGLVGHNRDMDLHDPSLNIIQTRSNVEDQVGHVYDQLQTAAEHCCAMHNAYHDPLEINENGYDHVHHSEEEIVEEPEVV